MSGTNVNNINISKLRIIIDKWREADTPRSNIDLNKLADYTLKIIDSEPLIKDICNAFLCSLSIRAIKDPNFYKDTYRYISRDNISRDNISRDNISRDNISRDNIVNDTKDKDKKGDKGGIKMNRR
jgi:hypothetical protein